MRSKYIVLLIALTLFGAGAQQASASVETFTTGKDWEERMSPREKIIAALAPAILLDKYGVPLRRPISEYIPTMDQVVLNNPYLENEDVANIFVSTVYASEPELRSSLDALEIQFRLHKIYEKNRSFNPHLLVSLDPEKDHESVARD